MQRLTLHAHCDRVLVLMDFAMLVALMYNCWLLAFPMIAGPGLRGRSCTSN
jgi:hypothetical protein